MCCVGRKKVTGKKVTINFFHIYYSPKSQSVYNYFCFVFVFDVLFCFFFICLCVFCLVFVLIFIQDLNTQTNKEKTKQNVKNKAKIIIHTLTFRGIVNVDNIYCDFFSCDFFSTDSTHTYNIILNTDTLSILIPYSQ